MGITSPLPMTTSTPYETLQAISNDCEAWLSEKSDISASDLLAAIKAAADSALSKAPSPSLAEALEALLDVFLDGRMDDLSEKEQRAYEMANAALESINFPSAS